MILSQMYDLIKGGELWELLSNPLSGEAFLRKKNLGGGGGIDLHRASGVKGGRSLQGENGAWEKKGGKNVRVYPPKVI